MGIKKSFRRYIPFIPVIMVLIDLALHQSLPDIQTSVESQAYSILLGSLGIICLAALLITWQRPAVQARFRHYTPLTASALALLGIWDLLTLKSNLLAMPYFPGPERVLVSLISDWQTLGLSTLYSLRLLVIGYLVGGLLGLATGIYIGWSRRGNYWIGPLIKIIGPIPATAWIPIAMVVFPTSFWASVFLIVLAVWFPVTVMTSSGIANVRSSYFEVARTLGAGQSYLVFHVAVPAGAPSIFIGLFMGLGASFITLIVAEMLGVKAGLGWYINWAQGWAEYSKVYASLIVIAVLFSGIIWLLFKMKDRLLVWQRGLIRW